MISNKHPQITVLIPAYNAEKTIASLVVEVLKIIPNVIVVDDASSDRTFEVLREVNCDVITHAENKGKGGALRTGFQRVLELNFDWVVIMDADGQHLPEDLSKFIQEIDKGECSFINGTRLHNPGGMPFIRFWTNRVMSKLISLILKISISDAQCGFKAFKTDLIRRGNFISQHFEIEDELIFEAVRLNLPIGHVDVATVYNDEESYINPLIDTFRFFSFLFRYSFKK